MSPTSTACRLLSALAFLVFTLAGCGSSAPLGGGNGAQAAPSCGAAPVCAGAAKRVITPTQTHIDGVMEPRLGAFERLQKFNLGGFGINPTQNLPSPFASLGESLTQPAQQRVYTNRAGREE